MTGFVAPHRDRTSRNAEVWPLTSRPHVHVHDVASTGQRA